MNPNEPGLIQFILLYFIFQVAIGTLARAMSQIDSGPYITKKRYLMLLIPIFGVFYAVYLFIKSALADDK